MFSYIYVCVADFDEANLFGECITRFGIFRVKFEYFFCVVVCEIMSLIASVLWLFSWTINLGEDSYMKLRNFVISFWINMVEN